MGKGRRGLLHVLVRVLRMLTCERASFVLYFVYVCVRAQAAHGNLDVDLLGSQSLAGRARFMTWHTSAQAVAGK